MVPPVLHHAFPSRRPAAAVLTLVAIVLATTFCGCPCISGPVNASPGLRWWLFANFGASKVCPEMLKQGVPLRLQDRSPTIGRFFPLQCSYTLDDQRQTLTVNVAGTGYGYMIPAKRIGFSLTASVEYRPDFQIAGDDVYVWGKMNRLVQGPNFQLGAVENPVVDVLGNVPPFGSIANFLGNQVVTEEMTRGFTVIHADDGSNDFTLGTLFPPQRPHHPFQVVDADRFTFANERVELHSNQRDYLGPFEITDGGKALYLTLSLQGPAIDVMVVGKATGDVWREAYQTGKPLGPPPGPIVAGGVLQPGPTDNRRYPLPAGVYYVVLDNTPAAGLVAPPLLGAFLNPLNPLADSPAAMVSYVAQLGN
jgi:hypothetical protein